MSGDGLRALRINAVELLRQPGATKQVDAVVDAIALGVIHDALDGDVTVQVELEALNDGVTVHGTVSARWAGVCRRCLTPLGGEANGDVDELYQTNVTDEDAYPIENNQLDLAPMARHTALLELDDERLCRTDCAGLCPLCGADLNVTTCECDTSVKDDRWAALDGLRLDE